MKKLLLLCCITSITFSLFSQTDSLVFSDFSEAQTFAKNHQKNILMVFAGSDWCRSCIQFKAEILEDITFKEYAEKNLVILYLDFPARRKNKLSDEQTVHNKKLADQYNPDGAFPKIVIIDKDTNTLGQVNFNNQVCTVFISEVDNITKK